MKRFHSSAWRGRAGFTLIEMVLVVVLIGILASLAFPAMAGTVNRSRLDRVSSQVAGDVAFARMAAVRRGEPVRVVFTAPTTYLLRRGTGANATVLKTVNLAIDHPGARVDFGPVAAGAITSTFPDSLVFNSRGVVSGGSERAIRTSRSGSNIDLAVSLTGRVRREKY